jgi:hypothetical protein
MMLWIFSFDYTHHTLPSTSIINTKIDIQERVEWRKSIELEATGLCFALSTSVGDQHSHPQHVTSR